MSYWKEQFCRQLEGLSEELKEVKRLLEEIRKKCEDWDEDIGCLLGYPEECPFHVECAEEEEEVTEESSEVS